MVVISQTMYFPLAHGTSVAPSGLFPSVLIRPGGSFVQGVSAFMRDLHTKTLTAKCLADLPAHCLQTSSWWPLRTDIGVGYTDPAQDTVQWPLRLPRC